MNHPATLPPSPSRPDPVALVIEGARLAAQRGRRAWVEGGGHLERCIDEAIADYVATLTTRKRARDEALEGEVLEPARGSA